MSSLALSNWGEIGISELSDFEIDMVSGAEHGVAEAFLVGAAAGTFVGAFVAGPPGAAAGALIGGVVGVAAYYI